MVNMDASSPSGRRRTEEQMCKKRATDRKNHKVGRDQAKKRLERIERDISQVRSAVESVLAQLQSGQQPPPPARISASPSSPRAVECRCGIEHANPDECLEHGSSSILYAAHVAISQNPKSATWIPRNPSLANMLFLAPHDNAVTTLLTTTLKQFTLRDTATLFGLYFLVYRLLRWRLYPIADTYEDIPSFMLPSEVQDTCTHPVSIDFLPWPSLREYLCLNQNRDSRHSVDLYLRSIQLLWPADKQLLCRDSKGDFVLHDDWEDFVSDLSNWSLGDPFASTFPQLLRYTQQ